MIDFDFANIHLFFNRMQNRTKWALLPPPVAAARHGAKRRAARAKRGAAPILCPLGGYRGTTRAIPTAPQIIARHHMDAPWGATGGQRCAAPARRGAAPAEQARSATRCSGAAQVPLLCARLSEGVKTPVILYGGNLKPTSYYICNYLITNVILQLYSQPRPNPYGYYIWQLPPTPLLQWWSACRGVLVPLAGQGRGAPCQRHKVPHGKVRNLRSRGVGSAVAKA